MDSNGPSKNTKTIQISEDVFTTSSKKKTKAKTLKRKPRPVIDTAQLQEQLLNNIKMRTSMVRNVKDPPPTPAAQPSILSTPKPTPPPKPLSEYEASLVFMNTIQPTPTIKRPKHSKPRETTTVNEVISTPDQSSPSISSTNTEPPSRHAYKIDTEVDHGCLKGGFKKTYKNLTFKNTSSHKVSFNLDGVDNDQSTMRPSSDTIIIHDAVPPASPEEYIDPVVLSGDTSLENVDKPIESVKTIQVDNVDITEPVESTSIGEGGSNSAVAIAPKASATIIRPLFSNTKKNKQQKKIRKTFKLGKQSSKRMVSVFCKNAEMITGLKKVHAKMKSVKLDDMKRYLVRKSLLSIGSPAPSDVIKQLYMAAVSSGDIINHNDAVLLKNFMET
jgi:hypothetical protein